ncbi:MAG: DUF5659 domain-containing protein [Bacteroidota bacterium]|jgi:hypothetical protein|nr:DUF5659 domain-containing protein [Bacteroidota bacterium]
MNNTIPVEDLYAAGFLLAHGIELKEHARRFGYSTFYFEAGEQTDKLIEQYLTDTTFMEFANAIRRLKSLMYSEPKGLNTPLSNSTNVKSAKGRTTA